MIFSVVGAISIFIALANVKPDFLKKSGTESWNNLVDILNFSNKPKKIQETYIKRERSNIEPSVFEQSE
jgi:hypothetical protein